MITLLAHLALLGSMGSGFGQAPTPGLHINDPTPPLQVGKWIKNAPTPGFQKDRITVVEFWATWCGPCKAAIPHLTELAKRYTGRVEFVGVDVLEKGDDPLPQAERMVAAFGPKMDYHVAVDDAGFMEKNWLKASGEQGIPATYVVDREGRLAWIGHPDSLESVLEKILAGQWSNVAYAAERTEDRRLRAIDNATIPTLNPLIKDPQASLAVIAKLLKTEPALKYRPRVGHFTYVAYVRSDEAKALAFAKEWLRANETNPPYGDIADMVSWKKDAGKALTTFGAECLEEQARRFPHMDLGTIYDRAAEFRDRAGDRPRALADARLAVEYAQQTPGYDAAMAQRYAKNLERLKAAATSGTFR